MKKIVLLLAMCIAISSCGVLQTRELQKQVMFIDYRPYVEAGLHLSPSDYPKPHTPVGELNLIIDPEIVKVDDWNVQESYLTAKTLLKMAVDEAIIRGANGISHLKIEVEPYPFIYYKKQTVFGSSGLTKSVNRYTVSGVLIRVAEEEE